MSPPYPLPCGHSRGANLTASSTADLIPLEITLDLEIVLQTIPNQSSLNLSSTPTNRSRQEFMDPLRRLNGLAAIASPKLGLLDARFGIRFLVTTAETVRLQDSAARFKRRSVDKLDEVLEINDRE